MYEAQHYFIMESCYRLLSLLFSDFLAHYFIMESCYRLLSLLFSDFLPHY